MFFWRKIDCSPMFCPFSLKPVIMILKKLVNELIGAADKQSKSEEFLKIIKFDQYPLSWLYQLVATAQFVIIYVTSNT